MSTKFVDQVLIVLVFCTVLFPPSFAGCVHSCDVPFKYTSSSLGGPAYPPPGVLTFSVFIKTAAGFCTGAIIDKDWVLTAAHCLENEKLGDLKLIAGISDFKKTESSLQEREATDIITHPKFKPDRLSKFDIALIKVKVAWNTTEYVNKILIAGDSWPQGNDSKRDCISSGFGALKLKDKDGGMKLKMWNSTGLHGDKSCPCTKNFQSRRLICLQPAAGVGLCQGDDGSGLVCYKGAYPFNSNFSKRNATAETQLRLYGVAHVIQNRRVCSFRHTAPEASCGDVDTISIYMYLCPLNKWISEHVPGVPPTFENCRGSIPKDVFAIVCMSIIIIILERL